MSSFTEEQIAVINSSGNIKVNAVAGSGKTTALIEYMNTRRDSGASFLYLAFNASVRREVSAKVQRLGIPRVSVETAHSLAYKDIVRGSNYTIIANYRLTDLIRILDIAMKDELDEYLIASHVKKLAAYYCNSTAAKIGDANYISVVSDPSAEKFVKQFYPLILEKARLFLNLMYNGDIEITHDFYLKMFHLSNPILRYDYILFDEGQDASPCMLDIFLRQDATKVIVGDSNQQIYGWRYAVNSLDVVKDFQEFSLTQSFRFDPDLAAFAESILSWKKRLNITTKLPKIFGSIDVQCGNSSAIIARSNLGLLSHAIDTLLEEANKSKKVYFEGGINSYTYAAGASLYDVLNLYLDNPRLIRDPMIRKMHSFSELKEYAEKSDERELMLLIAAVEKYGRKLPQYIDMLRNAHIGDRDDKSIADFIFSTAHRCKGLEYDTVTLVPDFMGFPDMKDFLETSDKTAEVASNICNEEINLLYVASTRARKSLRIPRSLIDTASEAILQASSNHVVK